MLRTSHYLYSNAWLDLQSNDHNKYRTRTSIFKYFGDGKQEYYFRSGPMPDINQCNAHNRGAHISYSGLGAHSGGILCQYL